MRNLCGRAAPPNRALFPPLRRSDENFSRTSLNELRPPKQSHRRRRGSPPPIKFPLPQPERDRSHRAPRSCGRPPPQHLPELRSRKGRKRNDSEEKGRKGEKKRRKRNLLALLRQGHYIGQLPFGSARQRQPARGSATAEVAALQKTILLGTPPRKSFAGDGPCRVWGWAVMRPELRGKAECARHPWGHGWRLLGARPEQVAPWPLIYSRRPTRPAKKKKISSPITSTDAARAPCVRERPRSASAHPALRRHAAAARGLPVEGPS